jgi:hypothetical protein
VHISETMSAIHIEDPTESGILTYRRSRLKLTAASRE